MRCADGGDRASLADKGNCAETGTRTQARKLDIKANEEVVETEY